MIDISDRFPEGEIITNKNLFFSYYDGFDILEPNRRISDGGLNIIGLWEDDLRLHYVTVLYFDSDTASYEMVRDTYTLG